MICIWSSWCHCHPIISLSSKIQNGLPFWCRLLMTSVTDIVNICNITRQLWLMQLYIHCLWFFFCVIFDVIITAAGPKIYKGVTLPSSLFLFRVTYFQLARTCCIICSAFLHCHPFAKKEHSNNRFMALCQDYPGEPVPEETLTHPPSWSSSNLYQLLPSTTIHSILLVQTTCLAVFLHNLFPCPVWSVILLRTQLLYSLPLLINDISLLVSNGTNCLNLFRPVRILASTAASASPSTLNMSKKEGCLKIYEDMMWPMSCLFGGNLASIG